MTKRILMKGNEAIAEAAIRAGCRFYAGYPITPQNQIPEYMSWRLKEVGGVFIQAESEISAINMVFGASVAGARAMTSSSSPGISLKQEGISYMAANQLPGVIVNIMRGGPGLGSIQGSQGDYFQATRGGGHGDYHTIVLAPSSVQEAAELTIQAFDLSDSYRIPVMILGDGVLGQMMEPLKFPEVSNKKIPLKPWALTGCKGRKPNKIQSLFMPSGQLEEHVLKLEKTYKKIAQQDTKWEEFQTDDAEIIIVAYGIVARIAKGAIKIARKNGIKVGLLRPITLWPFPYLPISKFAAKGKKFLVVEISLGQMLEDVKLGVNGKSEILFLGRPGAAVITPEDILKKIISR